MNYSEGGFPYGVKFAGPGPNESVVLTMDGIMVNGRLLKDTFTHTLYSTKRAVAGVPLPTSEFQFFAKAIGDQETGLNFADTYELTEIDTNMEEGKKIPKGSYMKVFGIEIRVLLPGATDLLYASSGNAINLPVNPTPVGNISNTNLAVALYEGGSLRFHVGDKDYEKRKFVQCPASYGASGFAGFGIAPGEATGDNVSVINNGFGRGFRLQVPRNIDGLRTFYVAAKFGYPIIPTHNFSIECALQTIYWRSVQ